MRKITSFLVAATLMSAVAAMAADSLVETGTPWTRRPASHCRTAESI